MLNLLPKKPDCIEPPPTLEAVGVWIQRIKAIHLERYTYPEQVFRLYWKDPDRPEDEPIDDNTEFGSEAGTFTFRQAIDGMEATGIWGFTDTSREVPIIHYWRGRAFLDDAFATDETALLFFAHELSHAIIEPLIAEAAGTPDAELLAEVVSAVAAVAERLSRGIGEPDPPEM